MFVSCEKKANLPWPEDIEKGVVPTLELEDQDQLYFKLSDLASDNVAIKFKVGVLYGEFSKLKLTVVTKPATAKYFDYYNQYTVAELTQTGTYTLTKDDIINSIDFYNDASDVKFTDKFLFFINPVTKNGTQLYSYLRTKKPDLTIETLQEPNAAAPKIISIKPGQCLIGDKFKFKLNGKKLTVRATGTDTESTIDDIIKAIDKARENNPTEAWFTAIDTYTNEATYLKITARIDSTCNIEGYSALKNNQVSGYGPNLLTNKGLDGKISVPIVAIN